MGAPDHPSLPFPTRPFLVLPVHLITGTYVLYSYRSVSLTVPLSSSSSLLRRVSTPFSRMPDASKAVFERRFTHSCTFLALSAGLGGLVRWAWLGSPLSCRWGPTPPYHSTFSSPARTDTGDTALPAYAALLDSRQRKSRLLACTSRRPRALSSDSLMCTYLVYTGNRS